MGPFPGGDCRPRARGLRIRGSNCSCRRQAAASRTSIARFGAAGVRPHVTALGGRSFTSWSRHRGPPRPTISSGSEAG